MTSKRHGPRAATLLGLGLLLGFAALCGYWVGFASGAASFVQPRGKGASLAVPAGRLREEAGREVRAMQSYLDQTNLEPALYHDVLDAQEKMERAFGRRNWKKAIASAIEIQRLVAALLTPVQSKILQERIRAQGRLRWLLDEGGELDAPLHVERVRHLIAEIEKTIWDPTADSGKATSLTEQVLIAARDGIIETKRKKCQT